MCNEAYRQVNGNATAIVSIADLPAGLSQSPIRLSFQASASRAVYILWSLQLGGLIPDEVKRKLQGWLSV